jgi:UDP-glucose:(heptosyl)LPS alpha-1,3-glucosyltransferase
LPRTLRIALVIDDFSSARGGGESYVVNLSRELLARGHEVHVVAARWQDPPAGLILHRVPVHWPGKTLPMIAFAMRSRRAVRAIEADVVHAVGKALGMNLFNPHGGIEARWLAQNFRSIRSPAYRLWKKFTRYASPRHHFLSWLERTQYTDPGVLRFVAISEMVRRDIVETYGIPPDRIRVVWNGVDGERFHPRNRETHRAAARAEMGTGPGTPVILHVSNNYRLKGLSTLIDALPAIRAAEAGRGAELWVLGRGRKRPYERAARALGVAGAVRFLGSRPLAERFYAAADVYAHPTFYDACSLAVLEAMASGLPVVTTATNGAAGYVRDGTDGFVLADAADTAGLADRILRSLDPAFRASAGSAARARAEEFPLSRNTREILEVYEETAALEKGR